MVMTVSTVQYELNRVGLRCVSVLESVPWGHPGDNLILSLHSEHLSLATFSVLPK